MKRVVLDTNVLISFLTDRNLEQQEQAATLLELARDGELEVILPQIVISEMVYVLGNLYRIETQEIARMIDDLLSSPGVRPTDEVAWARVLELWPIRFPDFAGGVLAAVTREQHHDAIATFDQKFALRLRREGLCSYWGGE